MPEIGEIRNGREIGFTWDSKYIWHACIKCGKERRVQLKKGQPVSRRCLSCQSKRAGQEAANWKGGRIKDPYGYIHIKLQPDDFFYAMTNSRGYVYEHRLVVAKALGRCLHPWELVHHKKGYAKDDNRYPKTLQLVMEGQHNQITILENRIKQLEERVTLLEAENALLKVNGEV